MDVYVMGLHFASRIKARVRFRKFFYCNVLYLCLFSVFALFSCTHGKVQVDQQKPADAARVSALEQRVARLENALARREEQLSTLRRELRRVTEQRDARALELEQANEEVNKLREENEVLKKKIDEILAPKPASPPEKQDIYVVELGDTLESIAGRDDIYGDRTRWKEIYEENKDVIGLAPDDLAPGTKLIIPRP